MANQEAIERYTQLRDSHAKGTPEHAAYYLIARALGNNDVDGLHVIIARRQEDRARHEQLGHHGPVQYYTREIELLQAGLAEMQNLTVQKYLNDSTVVVNGNEWKVLSMSRDSEGLLPFQTDRGEDYNLYRLSRHNDKTILRWQFELDVENS